MRLESLRDLDPTATRAVVINVGTDLVAARAVLSADRHVEAPLLVVNCDPTPASRCRFDALGERVEFDLLEAPVRSHGATLDRLFTELDDDALLLLDSDAEIRDPALIRWMQDQLSAPDVFGAGFTWGPFWVPESWQAPPRQFLYVERPWIPCTLLRVEPVRRAVAAGVSCAMRIVPNDVGLSRRASSVLAGRWGPPWAPGSDTYRRLPRAVQARLDGRALDGLRRLRGQHDGERPSLLVYDTAARVHEHLRLAARLRYVGRPLEELVDEVHHYSGTTRYALHGPSALDTDPAAIRREVVAHVLETYGLDLDRW